MIKAVNQKLSGKKVSDQKYVEVITKYYAELIAERFKFDVHIHDENRVRIEMHIPPFHYQILEEKAK